MTHYEIMKKAYDDCGIIYADIEDEEYRYLVLCGTEQEKSRLEVSQKVELNDYIEFNPDGSIASY